MVVKDTCIGWIDKWIQKKQDKAGPSKRHLGWVVDMSIAFAKEHDQINVNILSFSVKSKPCIWEAIRVLKYIVPNCTSTWLYWHIRKLFNLKSRHNICLCFAGNTKRCKMK